MWHEDCQSCHETQFFGLRRVVRLENAGTGQIDIDWACRHCGELNRLRTGSAVAA